MTGRAWKLTLVSEGEGSSFLVLAVASLPNEKYISIRGRGLGRGSSKLLIAHNDRADDGKGLEAHFSERRRREFLFGFSVSVFAK